jgi:hypothetical protein
MGRTAVQPSSLPTLTNLFPLPICALHYAVLDAVHWPTVTLESEPAAVEPQLGLYFTCMLVWALVEHMPPVFLPLRQLALQALGSLNDSMVNRDLHTAGGQVGEHNLEQQFN